MAMMETIIASEFTKVFTKCIIRYAKKYNDTHANVFVLLALNNEGEPIYRVLQNRPGQLNYQSMIQVPPGMVPAFVEEITMLNILDVKKIHFGIMGINYNNFAPEYIQKSLLHLAEQNNLSVDQISVLICTNSEDVFLFLCKWDAGLNRYCECEGGPNLIQNGPENPVCQTCGKESSFTGTEKFLGGIETMISQIESIQELF